MGESVPISKYLPVDGGHDGICGRSDVYAETRWIRSSKLYRESTRRVSGTPAGMEGAEIGGEGSPCC